MFDGLIYTILEKVENTCKKVRKYMIEMSLPNPCKSASEWRKDYEKWKKSKIFHPKQSASAITSENFLKSKADFAPVYMHNIGATKRALVSIMDEDKPRHSEKVNILA